MAELLIVITLIGSLLAGGVSLYRAWTSPNGWTTALYGLGVVLSVLVLVASLVLFWYYHRPRPDDTRRMLFQGVEYIRDVRDEPRPIIIHIVRVDLDAPGLEFLVTPATVAAEQGMFEARTTSGFLEEFDLQLAVNGDFYQPWWSNAPWDYYPHANDPVATRGLSASRGTIGAWGYVADRFYTTLYLSEGNVASFQASPGGEIYNAISGSLMVVQNGQVNTSRRGGSYITDLNPRTAIALDQSGRELLIVVVDGRQPNYSEGMTIAELGEIIIEYGGYVAQNLDGGGSVTLVIEGDDGETDVLNSPIDNRIPGRQRLVANHLGVYARPLEDR